MIIIGIINPQGHCALSVHDKLVVIGGGYGRETRQVWEYDTSGGWTRLTDSPLNLTYTAAACHKGYVHILGNASYNHRTHLVCQFIEGEQEGEGERVPPTIEWERSSRGRVPFQAMSAACVSVGKDMYFIGGDRHEGRVHVLDAEAAMTVSSTPSPSNGAACDTIRGNIGTHSAWRDEADIPLDGIVGAALIAPEGSDTCIMGRGTMLIHGEGGTLLYERAVWDIID
ncbi:hypothetical protein KIPB_000942 [Kipferlia bialata]|uniref:Galactose oxidase n=1 Tax=Kipferlia bialata TaxID=797122 RepID=A0A9K3CN97_9EUKA|nr:hypothetical protein KIPB_000942 [Kipferlia bialata]|eukprot:g942.t1